MLTTDLIRLLTNTKSAGEAQTFGRPMRHLYVPTWVGDAMTELATKQLYEFGQAPEQFTMVGFLGMKVHSLSYIAPHNLATVSEQLLTAEELERLA